LIEFLDLVATGSFRVLQSIGRITTKHGNVPRIEEIAKLLCWEKKYEKGEIAIWRKRLNADSCRGRKDDSRATFCKSVEVDDVWYACI